MASTLKVTNITTPDGNNSVTFDRPLAGDGNALVGVSPRNFIIDGDFTQWPTGTSFTLTDQVYHCALWENRKIGFTSLVATVSQETSVLPSSSNSNHSSVYSLKTLINTAEAVASGDFLSHRYWITGHDFARLRYDSANGAVFAFWARCSVAGTYSICLTLGSDTYSKSFVISSGDTWELIQIALPDMSAKSPVNDMHTGGGIIIDLILAASGTRVQANNTWSGSGTAYGVTGQTNLSDTLNATFYLSQVGLYLGSSAPTFTSPPISTVKDQVDWYVQRFNFNSNSAEWFCNGVCSTNTIMGFMPFRRGMRTNPSMTSTAASTFTGADLAVGAAGTSIALPDASLRGVRVHLSTGGTLTSHSGAYITRTTTNTAWIMADARH